MNDLGVKAIVDLKFYDSDDDDDDDDDEDESEEKPAPLSKPEQNAKNIAGYINIPILPKLEIDFNEISKKIDSLLKPCMLYC
jgi:hypothetical protein